MKLLDVVVFEESDKKRAILSFCSRCERSWEGKNDPEHEAFTLISPMGTAHVGADYGKTACGRDATGDEWWWPL